MSRLDPIPLREWPPEMREALAALRPPDAERPQPDVSGDRPRAMNALGVLAHHPRLTQAYHALTGHILYTSTISERDRELVILRVAVLRDAEYEWLQHVVYADELGIDDDELDRIRTGPDAPGWSRKDRALMAATDELVGDACISDETWAVLVDELDTKQVMDVVFAVGTYDLLAMAFRSFQVPIDDDLAAYHENRKRASQE